MATFRFYFLGFGWLGTIADVALKDDRLPEIGFWGTHPELAE